MKGGAVVIIVSCISGFACAKLYTDYKGARDNIDELNANLAVMKYENECLKKALRKARRNNK